MNKYILWFSLYILLGLIFVIFRFWKKRKFEKMLKECYQSHPSSDLVEIAFPLAMTVVVLVWPALFTRYILRRIRGEKNKFDNL